jgi:membrane protein implicated in regulation of membrane protease activity
VLLLLAIVAAILWLPAPWGIVAVAAAAVVELIESLALIWWSKRRRAQVGSEALVGRSAVAVTPLRPDGQVRVDGELWQARCEEGAEAGDAVRILRLEGLTLLVSR